MGSDPTVAGSHCVCALVADHYCTLSQSKSSNRYELKVGSRGKGYTICAEKTLDSNRARLIVFQSEKLQYSFCVWRQRYKDHGSRFMRSGPPAWSQMKPNTNSIPSTRPENQAPHVCCYKRHHTDFKRCQYAAACHSSGTRSLGFSGSMKSYSSVSNQTSDLQKTVQTVDCYVFFLDYCYLFTDCDHIK